MKIFAQRWYVSLIIIPFIINLFTNTISWSIIKHNSILTYLILSLVINVILIGEFVVYFRNQKNFSSSWQNDSAIIIKLLGILNLKDNEEVLKSTNHSNNFDYNYFQDLKNFIFQANKLENNISNKHLRSKLDNLKVALDIYLNFIAKNMASNVNNDCQTLSVGRELKSVNYELYQQRIKELDDSADYAYKRLEEFIHYLKQKNII
ncbi:MAG: hypothetical protein NTZ19_07185 [Bacteroidetes bacterium]|nr:hypothetical protein [Bacteroidota bacterium]